MVTDSKRDVPEQQAPGVAGPAGMRLAVLEDDANQAAMLEAWLSAAGHSCHVFATGKALGLGIDFFGQWAIAWIIAWITMLPFVILLSPLIQRAVLRLTAPTAIDDLAKSRR